MRDASEGCGRVASCVVGAAASSVVPGVVCMVVEWSDKDVFCMLSFFFPPTTQNG